MVKAGEGAVAGPCGWGREKMPGEGWKSQGVRQGQSWMAAASDEEDVFKRVCLELEGWIFCFK